MKRDGAEVAPARLERVRRTPQWDCSRRYQAPSQGGRALPCLVKMKVLRRQAVLLEATCRVSAVTQLLLENTSLIIFSTYRRRRRSRKLDPIRAGGREKKGRKNVAGESQKCERLRPAVPAPESSAPPRSSHVTASCGFTECLQAIDRHATAKQGIRD